MGKGRQKNGGKGGWTNLGKQGVARTSWRSLQDLLSIYNNFLFLIFKLLPLFHYYMVSVQRANVERQK